VNAAVICAPEILSVGPKDTGIGVYVKAVTSGDQLIGLQNRRFSPLSLAKPAEIRITRAIRGFRPGAERTISAFSFF
jgi:hypothetical protein